jgi:hypothetical protein
MPAQQRPRCHQQQRPLRPRQMNGRGGQQSPVSNPELRPRNLAAEDLELVPKHEQLDIFHVQAAPATNKRAQQSPNGEGRRDLAGGRRR